jgi:hypothetical protein
LIYQFFHLTNRLLRASHNRQKLKKRENANMEERTSVRVVIFKDADKWVAQCLEYDIGAQADDIDTLEILLKVALKAELLESIKQHGKPFGGIERAPARFQKMWDKRSQLFEPHSTEPISWNGNRLEMDMALAA